MAFEGLNIVTASMIARMQDLGIALNVISDDDPVVQHKLVQLGVNAIIVNLTEDTKEAAQRHSMDQGQTAHTGTTRFKRLG
jgi:hypothetical protein